MFKICLSESEFKRLEKSVFDSMEAAEKAASFHGTRESWHEAHEWLSLYKKVKTSVEIVLEEVPKRNY